MILVMICLLHLFATCRLIPPKQQGQQTIIRYKLEIDWDQTE